MRKENSDFKTGFVSEAGSFIDNRDYFAYVELDDMACYVIADGIDQDMDHASAEMVVKTVLENFIAKPSMSRRRLQQSLLEAHEWLKFESRRVRLKASILVVVTNYTRMIWASCGNARLYQFRSGRLIQQSKDQSLSQQLADQGTLPEENVSTHEERGNLLSYMGNPDRFEPYISPRIPLMDGDVLLLCTPGMWEQVNMPEMLDALEECKDPESLTDMLEEILLSKQRMSISNYTAAAIFMDKTYKEPPKNRKKWIKRIAIAMLALMLTGGGIWIFKAREAAQIAEAAANMVEFERDGDEYAADGDYAKALKSYSEARNAAAKVKDKVHKLLITNKQKLARTLVDGDEYLKDAQYDKAIASYTKALTDAENYEVFQEEDIQERIHRTADYEQIKELMKQGELKYQAQDYTGALPIFKKAYTAALEVSYEGAQKELEAKLDDTQQKIDGIRMETVNLQGDLQEQKGDRKMEELDYQGAMDAYMLAQEKYQSIGKLEKVLAMERKIAKADEKLNPVVPAVSVDNTGMDTGALSGSLGNGRVNPITELPVQSVLPLENTESTAGSASSTVRSDTDSAIEAIEEQSISTDEEAGGKEGM